MAGFQASDTMPKFGHVTDLREQWLVRTDGALAHRLQDREISSHLCENRYRNQQIREDFPVAVNEQKDLEHEARLREYSRRRQAEIDAEIAREMAEINLRRQRRQRNEDLQQPSSSRAPMKTPPPIASDDLNPEELGLSSAELEEIRRRMEQEERDARLARELSHEANDRDALLTDMKYAVEAQDGELARLLQEREYKKLQRAKEKARQKALLKKQQRVAPQQHLQRDIEYPSPPQAELCDAYSNPRDMIKENRLRLCKSVDSDLNYVEPFEKEHIESRTSALKAKEFSKQYITQKSDVVKSNNNISNLQSRSFDNDKWTHNSPVGLQHRHPPLPPSTSKKPRFPDPVIIRPASHYSTEDPTENGSSSQNISHSFSENNNLYSSTFPSDLGTHSRLASETHDTSKRLSVISDMTADDLVKKKNKQANKEKKRRGCKIQ
ncbi:uncharacterized protein LOC114249055 [Bombyx mandarina]|uniref:Coiled-coil domain-containing protein n=2 Tax=Bombyx TaxID=7090 RepID=A0A8R1WGS8_BOMMO|nr:uncharacterized protein LOC101746759 [Bombyx mori]XP_028038323.1 uncharacterized protein LOC114249055 [Bombyx mandarina]